MVAIIDYDAGNLRSVEKAVAWNHKPSVITRDAAELRKADHIILPGVGAFGDAMEHLKRYELDKILVELVDMQKPILGICLGLQLLFEGSEESDGVEGLGILKGGVHRIPDSYGLKIPHIGWNSLQLQNDGLIFKGLSDNPFVYFVHSYYLKAEDEAIVTATADYGVKIHAAVQSGRISACQFHPEKSGTVGLSILNNFMAQ